MVSRALVVKLSSRLCGRAKTRRRRPTRVRRCRRGLILRYGPHRVQHPQASRDATPDGPAAGEMRGSVSGLFDDAQQSGTAGNGGFDDRGRPLLGPLEPVAPEPKGLIQPEGGDLHDPMRIVIDQCFAVCDHRVLDDMQMADRRRPWSRGG
jgi:hypothetical protein